MFTLYFEGDIIKVCRIGRTYSILWRGEIFTQFYSVNLTGTDPFGVLGLHARIVFKVFKEIAHEIADSCKCYNEHWVPIECRVSMKQNRFKLSTCVSCCFTIMEVAAGVQNLMCEIWIRLWLTVLPTGDGVGNAWMYTSTPTYVFMA
jgi:hypothetical protein